VVAAHGILRERMVFNMTEDDWDGVIRAHLKGCFAMTKFASIHWRSERSGGRLIYFTSGAGVRGSAGQGNYSAAQAGKVGLMLSCARALSRYGVTANCISPRASTRMTDRHTEDESSIASDEVEGTARDPKNIVPPIVYLASDAGADVTGRVIGVEGHRVSMFREIYAEKTIYSRTPVWDIDRLFEVMPQTLAATGIEMPDRRA
jgi:NAD(P)-dependent dehydrogenase (short-subunit alcohol dehydrogenase family)